MEQYKTFIYPIKALCEVHTEVYSPYRVYGYRLSSEIIDV